jgi:hypothetical protein
VSATGGNVTLVRTLFAANWAGRGDPALHIQDGAGVRADQDGCLFRDNRALPPPAAAEPAYPEYVGLSGTAPPQ